MLHDIGTCDDFITASRLIHELFAGLHAFDLLQNPWVTGGEGIAPREQAECRGSHHQISGCAGQGKSDTDDQTNSLGDLVGQRRCCEGVRPSRDHQERDTGVSSAGWSGCFKRTVEKEKRLKPYAMVSRIKGFEEMIEKNGASRGLMEEHD